MKRFLVLGVGLLLAIAATASATTITATTSGGANFATLSYTRTALSGSNAGWDELDIHLAAWLQPDQISAGATANSVGGTFTGISGVLDLPNGNSSTWSLSTTNGWADGSGSGPKPAPQTYVNMDGKLSGFSRTASGSGYSSFTGNWYVSQDMQPDWNLGTVDNSTGSNDDGIDETLFSKVFVTTNGGVSFLADTSDTVHGLGLTTGTVTFAFSVPRRGSRAEHVGAARQRAGGALAYAWRKQR